MDNNKIMILLSEINQKYNMILPTIRNLSDEECNELIDKIKEYDNNKIVDNLIKLCIYLFNLQIFTDGNSRTIFDFMDMELNQMGYKIDFEMVNANYKYLRNFFPTVFLYENEEISVDDINRIKRYIIEDKNRVR